MLRYRFSNLARLMFLTAFVAVSSAATAQTPTLDSRWSAWVGCWEPTIRAMTGPITRSFICVVPAGSNAVEVATIDSGRVIARDTIDASGAQTPLSSEGCSGWRSGRWSEDARRVYLRSELNCSGGIARISSGVLAFVANDSWVDVQNVRAGPSSGTRSTRYVAAIRLSDVPAEFAAAQGSAGSVSRMLAASRLEPADVQDAVKNVDAAVVETWLIERGQQFDISGKMLASLADAGVPGSVTDVMIGVSYPDVFVLSREGEDASARASGGNVGVAAGGGGTYNRADAQNCVFWDQYWHPTSAYGPCYGNTLRYGYAGYYGYGAYGYYSPVYTGYYNAPVIVVERDRELPHGRMVNGAGYTRGRQTGGSSAGSDRSSGTTSSPPARSTSGSSKSGGSSSGGSSSSGRTAQKRGG